MHWPVTRLLPPWAPGAAHMLWRQRPDVKDNWCLAASVALKLWSKDPAGGSLMEQNQCLLIALLNWPWFLIFWYFHLSVAVAPQFANETARATKSPILVGFQLFFAIFFPIWPHSHTYETNFEKNSALTWFSWPQWRLKVFTAAYRGLPPPTQLTNANIQRWEIRVSWVGQSTT